MLWKKGNTMDNETKLKLRRKMNINSNLVTITALVLAAYSLFPSLVLFKNTDNGWPFCIVTSIGILAWYTRKLWKKRLALIDSDDFKYTEGSTDGFHADRTRIKIKNRSIHGYSLLPSVVFIKKEETAYAIKFNDRKDKSKKRFLRDPLIIKAKGIS